MLVKKEHTFRAPSKESERLQEPFTGFVGPWERWGPYVSDRAWGTVREDYSADGNSWMYFPHDHARSRVYRWNEDGLGAICDRYQVLVFGLALWNGKDPILKERLFGVNPFEANHGEDVKEYYYYLDNTPTHSYMKYLYKYPQEEFPYQQLIDENRKRTTHDLEYELEDTGIFDKNRYFDVFIEYAKATPDDICIKVEAFNRGNEPAAIHLIPQIWFRNTWSWDKPRGPEPLIKMGPTANKAIGLLARHEKRNAITGIALEYFLGDRYFYGSPGASALFTNNETNFERIFNTPNTTPYVKDAFHRYIINGEACVNPALFGTKACLHYKNLLIPPQGSTKILLRLSNTMIDSPLDDVEEMIALRKKEADAFYATVHPEKADEEEKLIQRQALAGVLWTKQFYHYRVNAWLRGDSAFPTPPESHQNGRNNHWRHVNTMRIMTMPDKWEYPWFAAWDLAFQTVSLALVDTRYAKEQLWYLLFEQFIQPNGQMPAYEWEFSDLNPPVHAWAVWKVYNIEKNLTGHADRHFLEKCFHKLILNFSWWVNRVDRTGKNIFEGGFLGLDNITIHDRSEPLPGGATVEQSDGTGWMCMYSLNLMRIALELAVENPVYESMAVKFFQHYVYIGAAMKKKGYQTAELWSERDGFFYDVLCYPDNTFEKVRIRSLVGIIPIFAVETLDISLIDRFPEFRSSFYWFIKNRSDLVQQCVTYIKREDHECYILAMINPDQLSRILGYVWDEEEFRAPYGMRSMSKYHKTHPFILGHARVEYEPGESLHLIKGGNSNWRGPIWFPTNFLTIETLNKLHYAYGGSFSIRAAQENSPPITPHGMAKTFAKSLINIFRKDAAGRRPCFNAHPIFQDKHFRDCILFYEHFHGDTGRGLGASHQTGWTGLVANLISEWNE